MYSYDLFVSSIGKPPFTNASTSGAEGFHNLRFKRTSIQRVMSKMASTAFRSYIVYSRYSDNSATLILDNTSSINLVRLAIDVENSFQWAT